MVDSVLPALCDHCSATGLALGRQSRLSFSTLSFNDGKFHPYSPMTNPRSIDCSIERLFRDAG
jgi:hypothetical protein